MTTDPGEPGYAEALAELEAILDELDDDRLDVDALAERVQRAAHLVALCRERVAGARLAVEEVVTDLDGDHPD
ncbi:MAG TPA: exodeoxyribonuclease VII small subunit [Acidimicrobiales bacterium]|jgi:exodeoxyribonuclease VII small subunit